MNLQQTIKRVQADMLSRDGLTTGIIRSRNGQYLTSRDESNPTFRTYQQFLAQCGYGSGYRSNPRGL